MSSNHRNRRDGHGDVFGEPCVRSSKALSVITLDLHDGDIPSDITFAAEWLARIEISATFFVPSAMFLQLQYAERLRELDALGHEVGSHAHLHDVVETDALIWGTQSHLGFLEKSNQLFKDFYGRAPLSFRSPAWCPLSPVALDELVRLEYTVDSSATPQRLSFLSSRPFQRAWTLAPRRLHYLRPGLIEVPTSTFAVPLGSPTFLTLRRTLSLAMVYLFFREALLLGESVVTLQFHAGDFNPHSTQCLSYNPLRLSDFLLRRHGGFGFKNHLRTREHSYISAMTQALVHLARQYGCVTLQRLSTLLSVRGNKKRELN